jgi:hypothetical protein
LSDPSENVVGKFNISLIPLERVNENASIESNAAMAAQKAREAG